jgi:hypothetical protein
MPQKLKPPFPIPERLLQLYFTREWREIPCSHLHLIEVRETETMLLMPLLFGSSLFFFLMAPVMGRLYGIDEITPELARRFADNTADVVLRGIRTRPEETP